LGLGRWPSTSDGLVSCRADPGVWRAHGGSTGEGWEGCRCSRLPGPCCPRRLCVRLQAVFYRGHDPQWAFSPISGTGAKTKGGRFNPIGVPAFDLGASIDTVIVEMTHGFARRLEPLTMVSYDVDVEDIVDLRSTAGRRVAGVKFVYMACPWELDLADGREPASWRVANRLRKMAAGILVPS